MLTLCMVVTIRPGDSDTLRSIESLGGCKFTCMPAAFENDGCTTGLTPVYTCGCTDVGEWVHAARLCTDVDDELDGDDDISGVP